MLSITEETVKIICMITIFDYFRVGTRRSQFDQVKQILRETKLKIWTEMQNE